MTSEKFAEIVGKAVKDGIIEERVAPMLNDRTQFDTPRGAVDDARDYGIIGNVAWLWFVSRIKEADSGSNPQ